jgi:hypothetical protein
MTKQFGTAALSENDLVYDSPTCNRFVEDMRKAGLNCRHYEGRYGWEGPAVRIPIQQLAAMREITGVKLQYDNLGKDYVVYPAASGHLVHSNTVKSKRNRYRRTLKTGSVFLLKRLPQNATDALIAGLDPESLEKAARFAFKAIAIYRRTLWLNWSGNASGAIERTLKLSKTPDALAPAVRLLVAHRDRALPILFSHIPRREREAIERDAAAVAAKAASAELKGSSRNGQRP